MLVRVKKLNLNKSTLEMVVQNFEIFTFKNKILFYLKFISDNFELNFSILDIEFSNLNILKLILYKMKTIKSFGYKLVDLTNIKVCIF